MGFWEAYSYVMADSFMSGLLFPIQMDIAYPAMRDMGGYNMLLATICASVGATGAVFLNYWIGKVTRLGCESQAPFTEETHSEFLKVIGFFRLYGHYGLLLAWVPLVGSLYTIVLGFAALPLRVVLLWALAGNSAYYIYASHFWKGVL
jgi:membrane protein YqaA with SNARE-associated domain